MPSRSLMNDSLRSTFSGRCTVITRYSFGRKSRMSRISDRSSAILRDLMSASTTVFPVRKIREGSYPSSVRFCTALSVGAKRKFERCSVVRHRHAEPTCRESRRENGDGVTLDDDHVRTLPLEHFTDKFGH